MTILLALRANVKPGQAVRVQERSTMKETSTSSAPRRQRSFVALCLSRCTAPLRTI